jgi:hypothetical protein
MANISTSAIRLDQMLREIYDASGVFRSVKLQAISLLIESGKLEQDVETLSTAQRGLKRIFNHHPIKEQCYRGRIQQMIDELDWFLRRLATKHAAEEIKWDSDKHILLAAIAKRQPDATLITVSSPFSQHFSTMNLLLLARDLEIGGMIRRFCPDDDPSWELTPLGQSRHNELTQQPNPARAE